MIEGLSKAVPPRIDALRSETVRKSAPVAATSSTVTEEAATSNPAADLAASGAPIDNAKVARIKAGLADGSYKVDPDAVANAMIAQDLPEKS